VRSVCGPIGISQVTADIYRARVASLDAFGGEKAGTMTMRNGRIAIVEHTPEQQAATRAVVESDIYAASGASRLLLSDDLFTRQVAAQLGAKAVSLQPVLITLSMASGLDGAQSETMPKLSGHLENAGTMCHDETQRTGGTP
jgi:hypothetical protein